MTEGHNVKGSLAMGSIMDYFTSRQRRLWVCVMWWVSRFLAAGYIRSPRSTYTGRAGMSMAGTEAGFQLNLGFQREVCHTPPVMLWPSLAF